MIDFLTQKTYSMSPNKPILILAYGNLSRGDDALAPLLLEYVENLPEALLEKVECLTDFQLQIEHALADSTSKCNSFLMIDGRSTVIVPSPSIRPKMDKQ